VSYETNRTIEYCDHRLCVCAEWWHARVHTAVTVVMSGLDNPRGLAFGPEGALYVVEAGRGGSGPCQMLRGLSRCYGATGDEWHRTAREPSS